MLLEAAPSFDLEINGKFNWLMEDKAELRSVKILVGGKKSEYNLVCRTFSS